MAACDCQSNSQWSEEARVGLESIGDSTNDEKQNEPEDEFEAKALHVGDVGTHFSVAKVACSIEIACETLQSTHCSNSYDVQHCANERHLSNDEQPDCDGGVDVASRDVTDCLKFLEICRFAVESLALRRSKGSYHDSYEDAQAESKCDKNEISTSFGDSRASEEVEKEDPNEFSKQGLPNVARLFFQLGGSECVLDGHRNKVQK